MAETKEMAELGEVRAMDFENTRGLRYSELVVVGPEWINFYNSIGLSESPPELWDALDAEAAAEQLGVELVIKNGPHWWMSDKATLRFTVAETTVGGIGYRVVGARVPAFVARGGKLEPPTYTVVGADKQAVFVYSAGRPVYELISPDGETFVMQSTGSACSPDDLATLGDRLNPPEGWQFRTRILDEELTLSVDGKLHIAMDDFHNVYNSLTKPPAPAAVDHGKALDVLIAIYPGPDSAQKDFDALVALVDEGTVETEGVVLVTRDADGQAQAQEKGIGRVGRKKVVPGIVEAMDEKLPPGAAGIIAIYKHSDAAEAGRALANAFTTSVAGLDHARPKELQAALKEAQAGL
jgi:hypothetical protein